MPRDVVAYIAAWLSLVAVFCATTIAYGWLGFALTYVGLSLVTCASQVGKLMLPMDWFMFATFSPFYFTTIVSEHFYSPSERKC